MTDIHFPPTRSKFKELPLTAMIDIVFILIFFFMLTTSFMQIESMELILPSATQEDSGKNNKLARIVIYNDGRLTFGQRDVDRDELRLTLQTLFESNQKQPVIVYTDTSVTMQEMVDVMDMVTTTGGKSLYVRPLPGAPAGPSELPALTE